MAIEIRSREKDITTTTTHFLTNIMNTSIACFGFAIIIELLFTYDAIHLLLNKFIILFSRISIPLHVFMF